MPDAISNTSPLLYLYRIGVLAWLPELFNEVWIPNEVISELQNTDTSEVTAEDIAGARHETWCKTAHLGEAIQYRLRRQM